MCQWHEGKNPYHLSFILSHKFRFFSPWPDIAPAAAFGELPMSHSWEPRGFFAPLPTILSNQWGEGRPGQEVLHIAAHWKTPQQLVHRGCGGWVSLRVSNFVQLQINLGTILGEGLLWWLRWYKNLPGMQETWVWSLDQEDPWEKGMATHSSILAWKILWSEEPGGLQSMGSQRVRHDWALTHTLILGETHLFLLYFQELQNQV